LLVLVSLMAPGSVKYALASNPIIVTGHWYHVNRNLDNYSPAMAMLTELRMQYPRRH
jgi:hypothetical protein